MSSNTIATIVKMVELLPDAAQNQVAEHLRDYIQDLHDEVRWDTQFNATQPQLIAAAREAKRQIAAGNARPLNNASTVKKVFGRREYRAAIGRLEYSKETL